MKSLDKKLVFNRFGFIVFLFFLLLSVTISAQKLDWLEDQPPTDKITRVQTNKFTNLTGYPRKSTGSLKKGLTAQQLACFDIVCQKPTSATVAAAQAINPNLSYFRIFSPQAWQGFNDDINVETNGYPFNTSGPSTANNQVFSGHWAYQPYTTLSAGITSAAGITMTVSATSKIQDSTYCVIRPSINDWTDAEHVYVTKIGSILTLDKRGYKSTAKAWPAGSVIAQHTTGNGPEKELFVYNLSTECPEDSNGKKMNDALSAWLVNHYDKTGTGSQFSASVDGILYDADPIAFVDGGSINTRDTDLDNDGVSDWGYDIDGTNFWGEGLELFYKRVRDGIDDKGRNNLVILGGVAESYGVLPNNGAQMEAAWSHLFDEDGAIAGANAYDFVPFYMSGMKAQTGHGFIGPRVTDVQGKEASALYHGTTGPSDNRAVRFSYAMTMMFNGAWFSNQNGFGDAFHYFDEDAVYTQGANYGKSVLISNTTDIRANNKWLGNAKGQYQRIYDAITFATANNKITNGNFESSISGWTTTAATVTRVTDKKHEGSASLLITPTIPNTNLQLSGSKVTAPAVSLTLNQEYTLCFAAYSDAPSRIIRVTIGSLTSKLFLTPGWSKHVLCWKEKNGVSSGLKIEVGAELTKVWIDQLGLYTGSADVLRRDFDNGIILANASYSPKTYVLGKPYKRILGNLDAIVNNGQVVTEVTIPAHDGLFLINQSTTDVEEINELQITVYPNPFNHNFSILIPNIDVRKLDLYNSNGVLICSQNVVNKSSVEVTQLANSPVGIYFAKLSGSNGMKYIKIIKN